VLLKKFYATLAVLLGCVTFSVQAKKNIDTLQQKVSILNTNPVVDECENFSLQEFECLNKDKVSVEQYSEIDNVSQFCKVFEKTENRIIHNKKKWVLVDSIVLRLGGISYTRREIEQCNAVEAFLKKNGEDVFSFNPGFSATHALSSEAKLLGLHRQDEDKSIASEILSTIRERWKISDSQKFGEKLLEKYGFSENIFSEYITQRQLALSILLKLNPNKKPNIVDFVQYLREHGEDVSIKYDLDIAILNEKEIADLKGKDKDKDLSWISFGFLDENSLNEKLIDVVEKMAENTISNPIFLNNEYYIIKKKASDISSSNEDMDRIGLWKKMYDEWLLKSVTSLQDLICCKAVKTVLLEKGEPAVTSEGEAVTSEGEAVTSEGEAVTSEGEAATSEGEAVTSRDEVVASRDIEEFFNDDDDNDDNVKDDSSDDDSETENNCDSDLLDLENNKISTIN